MKAAKTNQENILNIGLPTILNFSNMVSCDKDLLTRVQFRARAGEEVFGKIYEKNREAFKVLVEKINELPLEYDDDYYNDDDEDDRTNFDMYT